MIFSIPMVHELLGGSAANGQTRVSVDRNSMDSRSSAGNAVKNTEHKHRTSKFQIIPKKALGEFGNAEILDRLWVVPATNCLSHQCI